MPDAGTERVEVGGQRLLRLRLVLAKTALSRSSLYRKLAAGRFPRPVELGANSVAWLESEIDAWIAERPRSGSRQPCSSTEASAP